VIVSPGSATATLAWKVWITASGAKGDGLGAAVGGKEPGGAVGGRAVGVAAGRVGTSVTVAGPGVGVGTRPVAVAAPEVAVAPISGVGPARCAVGVGGTGVAVRPGPIAQLNSSKIAAAATNRPVRSPADQREPRRPPGRASGLAGTTITSAPSATLPPKPYAEKPTSTPPPPAATQSKPVLSAVEGARAKNCPARHSLAIIPNSPCFPKKSQISPLDNPLPLWYHNSNVSAMITCRRSERTTRLCRTD
jgi:hypothetical protein